MKTILAIAGLLALSACANTSTVAGAGAGADPTLAAIKSARPAPCPAASVAAGARTTGELTAAGITEAELVKLPLSNDASQRSLRLRRLTIAPNGVIAWHEHSTRQAASIVITGALTEYRNTCRDPIRHVAGDVINEDAGTAHWWRNESGAEAIILVFDTPPPA